MSKEKRSRLERSQEKTIIDVARGKAKCDAATEYIKELDKEFDGEVFVKPADKKRKKKEKEDDPVSMFKKAKSLLDSLGDDFF